MNGLFTKIGRMGSVAAVILLAVTVGGAFAQTGKRKSPGSDICVAKNLSDFEDAQYTSIQEAVNAARAGQVIEILDTSTYAEQVTIDGRDVSPWDGKNDGPVKKVVGGKNGITIRYVVAANAPWNHPRPTIKYQDKTNTSPKNKTEAGVPGDQVGSSGNFETCGALRVIRAKGVTLEGIAVDGGGAYAFGGLDVWCNAQGGECSPLNHGNAAVAVAVSGQVTIRDCDLKNAFFGISVKDRNTGGVFGNPNKSDNDLTIPLSGFGVVGGHLFEYNKVSKNVVAFFFESAWDLGSTIRYNLVFSNRKSNINSWPWVQDGADQKNAGAFMFKDMYLSPIAIYNNTLYDNSGNFIGHWQSGGQHLIFNNIFSKSTPSENVNHMSLDNKFPNRMNSCVFSVDSSKVQTQCQQNFNCAANAAIAPGGCWVVAIQDGGGIPQTQGTPSNFADCNNPNGTPQRQNRVAPGFQFNAANDLRWLQTEGMGQIVPRLFKSLTPTSEDFLVPDWENDIVKQYIQNKGWEAAGIRNNDGKIADLGAIPSTGTRQTTVARILPTNVVLITGSTATSNFTLKIDNGTITNPKIKFLRWIMPVPANTKNTSVPGYNGKDWPGDIEVIASGSIRTIANTSAVKIGNNSLPFAISGTVSNYGFFEIIVEGTDAAGNVVTTDVGFLPYRKLDYKLDIKIFANDGSPTTGAGLSEVKAGVTYRVVVTPQKSDGTAVLTVLNEVTYSLLSDPTAFMYDTPGDKPRVDDKNVPANGKTYTVYFAHAGQETIMGSGLYESGSIRNVYLGTKDLVVKPGDPDHVTFLDPIPVSQLGTAPAPVINRGVDKEVRVEVQDKFGNAVDVATPVSIVSEQPNIGDVGAPGNMATKSVNSGTDGVATFIARVTNGRTGETFDMTASITANNAKDVGRLRLGRALDRLEVFYSDTTAAGYDPDAKIDGNVGDWFKVTVKVLVSDSVNTAQTSPKVVSVSSADNDAGLVFSATEGGAPAAEFPLNRGVATFWISGTKDVTGACIDVEALVGPGGAVDGGISPGNRCDITFIKPSSSILRAVVYGDGHGRPDSLLIYYAESDAKFTGPGAVPKPTKVTLAWPTAASGVVLTANEAAISIRGDYLLHVNLAGAAISGATAKPRGYTLVERKIVTVYGEAEEDDGFDVVDGIGPVIGVDNDEAAVGSPILTENMNAGVDDDEIKITVSEQLRSPESLKGKTLFYTKDANPANEPGASGGDELEVVDAFLSGPNEYQVTVKAVAGGLQPGYWIRFNPSGGVADRAKVDGVIEDNTPHPGNRWAQLKLQEVAPSVKEAWYTSSSFTGVPDYAYVRFDKNVVLADWFSDGSVNFGKNDVVNVATAGLTSLFAASGDTLRINLATAFKSSQTSIRTSEDMPFTLGYASSKKNEWEGKTSVDWSATDRAKPVLADTVFLYIGDFKEDGSTTDTLRVTYSERPSDEALALDRPVTIATTGGGTCEPVLKLFGQVVPVGGSSRFYKATYLIEGDLAAQCPVFPETGNMVRIENKSGFGDDRNPSNIQDVVDNLHQPLKVLRELKWSVKVKGNPFKSDAAGSSKVKVEISPNAPPGVNKVNIDATILVFDNLGALVRIDTLKNAGENKIEWPWDGTNQKGRLVGTGTYLFKALCRVQIVNDGGETETMPSPPAVVRSLGVIRGRN